MLALCESTEFFCNIFCSNICLCWRREHFKMSLAKLALDALVFLLDSPTIEPERLLLHVFHVFPPLLLTQIECDIETRRRILILYPVFTILVLESKELVGLA